MAFSRHCSNNTRSRAAEGQGRALATWVALVGAFASLGCGAFAGASALVPLNGNRVEYGPTAGYRAYLESLGVALGGSATVTFPQNAEHGLGRGLFAGQVLYSNMPLPIEGRWGFEGGVGPVLGWTPERGSPAFAMGWNLDVGVPFRVSNSTKPWLITTRALSYVTLEPVLTFTQLFPVSAGRGTDNLLVVALRLRLDEWLVVQP